MHDAITIGIPVFAILFGILLNQRGLDKLEGRMDKLDGRMDKMELRFDARFTHLESRIDRIQADLSQVLSFAGGA